MTLTKDSVLAALRTVADPQSGSDIVTAGIARAVTVEDGAVRFVLEIDPAKAESYEPVRAAAQAAVQVAGLCSGRSSYPKQCHHPLGNPREATVSPQAGRSTPCTPRAPPRAP